MAVTSRLQLGALQRGRLRAAALGPEVPSCSLERQGADIGEGPLPFSQRGSGAREVRGFLIILSLSVISVP